MYNKRRLQTSWSVTCFAKIRKTVATPRRCNYGRYVFIRGLSQNRSLFVIPLQEFSRPQAGKMLTILQLFSDLLGFLILQQHQ